MTAEVPAPRSAASYFGAIVANIRYAMRYQDTNKLHAFLASEKFITSIAALPPADRVRAMGIMSEAMGAPAPVHRKRGFPPPRRCIKWTELNKARFKKAWLQGGHETAARAMGITYRAARLAAKRQGLLVAPATAPAKKAA